jgi:hypothetical protein
LVQNFSMVTNLKFQNEQFFLRLVPRRIIRKTRTVAVPIVRTGAISRRIQYSGPLRKKLKKGKKRASVIEYIRSHLVATEISFT